MLVNVGQKRITEGGVALENEKSPWMRVPAAARYFGIPRSRMYELIQNGDLPAVRVGERSIRIHREEAERFLRENRTIVS